MTEPAEPTEPAESAEPTQPDADRSEEELAARVAQVRRDAIKGKRRLASSVLAMEVVVFWLAIIVAIVSSGVSAPAAIGVGGALALACVLIAARITRRWAFVAGSILQLFAVACGVVVPTMFFIGAVFALLWFAALRVGDSAIRVADRFAASVRK